MSITDELREYAQRYKNSHDAWSGIGDDLDHIADRIDTEHEAACAEAYGNGVESVTLPDLTKYVKLPVDADCVPIRLGDTLHDDCDYELGSLFEVEYMQLKKEGWLLVEKGGWCHDSKECHHRHKPTVEDVLEEYRVRNFDLVIDMECKNITNDEYVQGINSLNAEYAAKLCLAERT